MAHSLFTCRNRLGMRSFHPRQIRKSNHQYHEPLIFYSQRVSPFRVEHSKNNYKDDIEKAIENDSFFLFTHLLAYSILLFAYPLLSKDNNPQEIPTD